MSQLSWVLIFLTGFTGIALSESKQCGSNTIEAFVNGSATGVVGAIAGQYFSAKRTADQLGYVSPNFKQAYKGLYTNIAGAAPILAVQSMANNAIKNEMRAFNQGSPLSAQQQSVASLGAGIASCSIVLPLNNVWVAQQQLENKDKSAAAIIKDIYSHRGFSGFYRGLVPSIAKQATRASCLFAAYPQVSAEYCRLLQNNAAAACATGLTIGPIMGLITHPLDTLETRLQGDIKKEKYPGTWSALKDAIRTKSLWRGWRWQMVGSVVNSTVTGAVQQWISGATQRS